MPGNPIDEATVFRVLYEATSDAVLVVDADGTIVLANNASATLLGEVPGTLAGQRVESFVPARFRDHGRHHAEFLAQPRARSMGSGLELHARRADGREIPVDISLTPMTASGRPLVACTIRDLSRRILPPESVRIQATALRSAANGVVITDRTGTITWVNPAACAITGYSYDELVGRHTRILKSGRHDAAFYAALWQTVTRGDTWSGTIVNRRKDGSEYDEEQTIAPVFDEDGAITHFIAIKQDVTEQRRIQNELAARMAEIESLNGKLGEQVVRDPLTGLHNRRYLEETMNRDLSRANRYGESLVIAMIDVDHFKSVNDVHGHAVGDRVLQQLADVLLTNVRSSDLVCRVGGEEFVAVMANATMSGASERAKKWTTAFAARAIEGSDGTDVRCTISIGLAQYRGGEPFSDCLRRADQALYAAKRAGRDRVMSAEFRLP